MTVNIEEIVKKIVREMVEDEEIKLATDDGGQLYLEAKDDYAYEDDEDLEENEDDDEDEDDEEGSEED